jgi:hypothetical protein
MSEFDRLRPPDSPQQRNGCLTAFLVLAGLVLLLPGLCTIILFNGHIGDPSVISITQITFGVGFVGLILIVVAVVRR